MTSCASENSRTPNIIRCKVPSIANRGECLVSLETPNVGCANVAMKGAVLISAASALLLAHATRARCEPLAAAADVSSPVPCSAGVYRQFDFWVGDCDVFDVDRPAVVVARAR
jgi:hypothetical protein